MHALPHRGVRSMRPPLALAPAGAFLCGRIAQEAREPFPAPTRPNRCRPLTGQFWALARHRRFARVRFTVKQTSSRQHQLTSPARFSGSSIAPRQQPLNGLQSIPRSLCLGRVGAVRALQHSPVLANGPLPSSGLAGDRLHVQAVGVQVVRFGHDQAYRTPLRLMR